MPYPLLAAKLYIPRTGKRLVYRPHLIERLDAGFRGRLTLISAPADYGKTTLIAQWLSALAGKKTLTASQAKFSLAHHSVIHSQIAWLSLDEADNDLRRFFSYMIAALQETEIREADLRCRVFAIKDRFSRGIRF